MQEGGEVREFYSQLPRPALVGIEAIGPMRWFLDLQQIRNRSARLTPAIARLPFAFIFRKSSIVALLAASFLLVLVAYDLRSTRRIHRATLWAGSLLILALETRVPIGKTAAWHAVAASVQHLVR